MYSLWYLLDLVDQEYRPYRGRLFRLWRRQCLESLLDQVDLNIFLFFFVFRKKYKFTLGPFGATNGQIFCSTILTCSLIFGDFLYLRLYYFNLGFLKHFTTILQKLYKNFTKFLTIWNIVSFKSNSLSSLSKSWAINWWFLVRCLRAFSSSLKITYTRCAFFDGTFGNFCQKSTALNFNG